MADYYDNKTVFITGGSSGIGLAIARALAVRGAHIAIFARGRDKLDAAREDIASQWAKSGQSVKAYTLDVEKIDTINPQLQSALDELGVPDIVVTCAGGGVAKSFEDHHLADFSLNFNTNVLGTFGFVHALVPAMKLKGGGNIVLIGSLGGLVPVWGYSAYSSSKAALVGFADVLQQELKPEGFTISLVCPPETATPMIAAEAETIPAQTRFAKDLVGTVSAEAVAESTLRGVAKGKHLIIHGARGKLIYQMKRLFPGTFAWSVRVLLRYFSSSK